MTKKVVVCVIGLRYVGLPLAVEEAVARFKVIGVDVSQDAVGKVDKGISYIKDVSDDALKA